MSKFFTGGGEMMEWKTAFRAYTVRNGVATYSTYLDYFLMKNTVQYYLINLYLKSKNEAH